MVRKYDSIRSRILSSLDSPDLQSARDGYVILGGSDFHWTAPAPYSLDHR